MWHMNLSRVSPMAACKSAFLYCLVQDYLFLIHFSRAWALAVTKAGTVDEMRSAAATVNALVNDEISLHIRICAAAGFTRRHCLPPKRGRRILPIRYVLDAGHSGDFLDLMAALPRAFLVMGKSVRVCSGLRRDLMPTGSTHMAAPIIKVFVEMLGH